MNTRSLVCVFIVFLLPFPLAGAPGPVNGSSSQLPQPTQLQQLARAHYGRHYRSILEEFAELLALPNHAHNRADIERNLIALEKMLRRRGLSTRRLNVAEASPALYAENEQDSRRATLLFYAHYDGQPVGSSGWNTPPFEPILERNGRRMPLREALPTLSVSPDDQWRIYARSSGDDKGTIVALIAALDVLAAERVSLAVNLKVFLEGEEEVGSPHLTQIVRENAELLAADLLLFADGPRHQSGKPQVVLGVRGIQTAQLTLFGPARALHSGHYGNWIPNPAARLGELLSLLRRRDGHVQIEGFYDPVDDSLVDSGATSDPELERQLMAQLRVSQRESAERTLSRSIAWPALNIVGLHAGETGSGARNAIPTEASASLDFRLVPAQTPAGVRRQLEDHLRKLGYRVVNTREVADAASDRDRVVLVQWGHSGYAGARFREDAPPVRALITLLRDLYADELLIAPILGGSLPLSLFAENSPVSAIVVLPIANYDNNQHAPNENLTLGSLRYGIETFTAVLGALPLERR